MGARSTNPWEFRVRARSTGSPPGPTRGSSIVVTAPRSPGRRPRPPSRFVRAPGTCAPCSGFRRPPSSTTCPSGSCCGRRRPRCTSGPGTARNRWNDPSRSARNAVPNTRPMAPRMPPTSVCSRFSSHPKHSCGPVSWAAWFNRSIASWSRGAPAFSSILVINASRTSRPHARSSSVIGSPASTRPRSRIHRSSVGGVGGKLSSMPGAWSCSDRKLRTVSRSPGAGLTPLSSCPHGAVLMTVVRSLRLTHGSASYRRKLPKST